MNVSDTPDNPSQGIPATTPPKNDIIDTANNVMNSQ